MTSAGVGNVPRMRASHVLLPRRLVGARARRPRPRRRPTGDEVRRPARGGRGEPHRLEVPGGRHGGETHALRRDLAGSGRRGRRRRGRRRRYDVTAGDRVWVYLAQHQRRHSAPRRSSPCCPADRVVPLATASYDVGASLGVPAMTAHRALTVHEDGPDRLSPGALDGPNRAGDRWRRRRRPCRHPARAWAGATVITTVSSDEKAALATSAGAHHVVNYRTGDAAAEIKALAPDGVDLVVEVAISRERRPASARCSSVVAPSRSTPTPAART